MMKLGFLLILLFFFSVHAETVPISVRINSYPELELKNFSVNLDEKPLFVQFVLENTGNSFTEIKPSVYIEQAEFKQRIFLPVKRIEWKASEKFIAFIEGSELMEGTAKLTLFIEFSSGEKSGLITEEKEIFVAEPEKIHEGLKLLESNTCKFAGLPETKVEGEIRLWNETDKLQEIVIFALQRQDLIESKTLSLEPKSRKTIELTSILPLKPETVKLIALSEDNYSNILEIELESFHPPDKQLEKSREEKNAVLFVLISVIIFFTLILLNNRKNKPFIAITQPKRKHYLAQKKIKKLLSSIVIEIR